MYTKALTGDFSSSSIASKHYCRDEFCLELTLEGGLVLGAVAGKDSGKLNVLVYLLYDG